MKFAYIVTIHNSEHHLAYVLQGIKNVMGAESKVYCVLDGCTDGSESIVDDFGFNKIITPNVRETKAITTALNTIPKADYYFILQDDVVLQDPDTEKNIKDIYTIFHNIGVLGMRHGCNMEDDWLTNGKHASEKDLICNEFQPDMGVPKLQEGLLVEREIVYKSPICLSGEVVEKLGGYDPRFEPIAHDDTEYCLRAIKEGYKNYVYALKLMQPIQWGGTRRHPEVHKDNLQMHVDHMNLLRKIYG
jgi:GT2 family glycosyltransferase